MKLYFILLSVLYASSLFARGLMLSLGPPVPLAVVAVLDIALFGLCLAGAYELAYGKRLLKFMTVRAWSLAYQATLALGVVGAVYKAYASGLDNPETGAVPGVVALALGLLSYILFALPVILLAHDRKKQSPA